MQARIRLWALFAAVCSSVLFMRSNPQGAAAPLLLLFAAIVFCGAVIALRGHRRKTLRNDAARDTPIRDIWEQALSFIRAYTLCLFVCVLLHLAAQAPEREDPRRACWLVKECYGRVLRIAEKNGRARLHIQTDSALFIDGSVRPLRGEIVAFMKVATRAPAANQEAASRISTLPQVYERVALAGELEELPQGEKRNAFWDYLEDENTRAVMHNVRALRVLESVPAMRAYLNSLRAECMEYFAPLGERSQALMGALVFGERSGLTRAERQEFADAGIIHMMAVSGMHVAVISGVVFWLFSLFGIGRRIALPMVCLFLFVYASLCAWTPSVTRAVFSIYVFAALSHFRARSSPPDILIMVASILLFVFPSYIRSAGFLLSFAATAGILFLSPPLRQAFSFARIPKIISNSLAVSLAAQLAVAPILAVFFGRLSLLAPLVNCVYVPFILCIQAAGCLMPLVYHLPGGRSALGFFQGVVDFLFDSISRVSAFPATAIDVPRYSPAVVLGYYVCVMLIVKGLESLAVRRRKNRESALAAQLAGLLTRPRFTGEARDGAELPCEPSGTHAHYRERQNNSGRRAA